MTSLEVCPGCGGTLRVYEDPEDGTVSGTCPQCRQHHCWSIRRAEEPEPEPAAPYEPEPARADPFEVMDPNTLIYIKDASTRPEQIAEVRSYILAHGGIQAEGTNTARDRHYIHTAGTMRTRDFNRFLDSIGLQAIGWTWPAGPQEFKRRVAE